MKLDIDVLPDDWAEVIRPMLDDPKTHELQRFLEPMAEEDVLPASSSWFNALQTTPLSNVKVVILGQDPYPTPGHAHGLSFSVRPDVRPYPKSLVNIFKELTEDTGIIPETGCLQAWAEQGVLLLNTVLTVTAGKAGSHQKKGWEQITDRLIDAVNAKQEPCVFVLWGAHAQKKAERLDASRHLVLQAPHPSPLSAYRGFFGSQPFSKANEFLLNNNRIEIDWRLPATEGLFAA